MISVVIPAYNEERLIGQCLAAFARQKTARRFEVILVDNNSVDRTQEIARRFLGKFNLVIVFEQRRGRGQARATGFSRATGDIIASTDADTTVPDTWVETIGRTFETNPGAVAITGPSTIHDCDAFTNAAYNFIQPIALRAGALVARHQWLNGFNFATRKSAYDASGGFDPNLHGMEDVDIARKLGKVGATLFVPAMAVEFSGRRYRNGLLSGLFDYVKGIVHYARQNGNGYLKDIR